MALRANLLNSADHAKGNIEDKIRVLGLQINEGLSVSVSRAFISFIFEVFSGPKHTFISHFPFVPTTELKSNLKHAL